MLKSLEAAHRLLHRQEHIRLPRHQQQPWRFQALVCSLQKVNQSLIL